MMDANDANDANDRRHEIETLVMRLKMNELDQAEASQALMGLVEKLKGLIMSIATKILKIPVVPKHLEKEILQSGGIGLWKAAQTYDCTRGVLFTTFSYKHIQGAIFDDLRKKDVISIPDKLWKLKCKVNLTIKELGLQLGERLNNQHVAEYLNVTNEEVDEAITFLVGMFDYIDHPANDFDDEEPRAEIKDEARPLLKLKRLLMKLKRWLMNLKQGCTGRQKKCFAPNRKLSI